MLALSTGQRLGLLGVALVFIAFALSSSFLFPRYRPDFPGRGLGLFIAVTVILTIAMLGAVEVFAVEEEEHGGEAQATETTATTTAETTTVGETTTEETTTAETTTEPAGDAAAGEAVFAEQGCGTCHVFAAAGSSGTIGPNLDETLTGKDAAFVRESIVDPSAEVAEGYPDGVMPKDYGEKLSDKQLNDLVAFLTQ